MNQFILYFLFPIKPLYKTLPIYIKNSGKIPPPKNIIFFLRFIFIRKARQRVFLLSGRGGIRLNYGPNYRLGIDFALKIEVLVISILLAVYNFMT